jgi:AhpD family alkylhydroperoxidase
MNARIKYWETAPGAYSAMGGLNRYLATTKIDKQLRLLVEIFVSQINGCTYCIDRHTRAALADGVDRLRIESLQCWQESLVYTARERAALAWAQALTLVVETRAPQAVYESMRTHFDEVDTVDLTLIISVMNAWNRMAIGFDRRPNPNPHALDNGTN